MLREPGVGERFALHRGHVLREKDVARVELGSQQQSCAEHHRVTFGVATVHTCTGPAFRLMTLTVYVPALLTGTVITATPDTTLVVDSVRPLGSTSAMLTGSVPSASPKTETE